MYKKIKNLGLIRAIAKLMPLKQKLDFMIAPYMHEGNKLAIEFGDWFVLIDVNAENKTTISNLILEGPESHPERSLVNRITGKYNCKICMVDVGGNIGTFFSQFISITDQVIVFEPIPNLANVIANSIEYNKSDKVHLVREAVGDKPGEVQMLDNNNSNVVSSGDQNALTIRVVTLDEKLAAVERIDLIKIDVEGYEFNVIKGALNTIQKHRPDLLIEIHPEYLKNYGHNYRDIINMIEDLGYDIEYYSFLSEQRLSKMGRLLNRWSGNKGKKFRNEEAFFRDVETDPRLLSYHLFCASKTQMN